MKRNPFVTAALVFSTIAVATGLLADGLYSSGAGTIREKLVTEDNADDSSFPRCWLRLKNGDTEQQLRVPLKVFRAAAVGESFTKRRWSLAYEMGQQQLYSYFSTVVLPLICLGLLGTAALFLKLLRRKEEETARRQAVGRERSLSGPKTMVLVFACIAGAAVLLVAFHHAFHSYRDTVRRAAYEAGAKHEASPPNQH
jgi:hypothetical protein